MSTGRLKAVKRYENTAAFLLGFYVEVDLDAFPERIRKWIVEILPNRIQRYSISTMSLATYSPITLFGVSERM